MKLKLMIIAFSFALVMGCSKPYEGDASVDPKAMAEKYANQEGLNLSECKLFSLSDYRDGDTSTINPRRTDKYAVYLRGKLRGKAYWEACYEIVEQTLGGDQCFYIDKKDAGLIAVHRSR